MGEETSKKIELRLIIEPDDEIYQLFLEAKQILGTKTNSETARVLLRHGYDIIKKNSKMI